MIIKTMPSKTNCLACFLLFLEELEEKIRSAKAHQNPQMDSSVQQRCTMPAKNHLSNIDAVSSSSFLSLHTSTLKDPSNCAWSTGNAAVGKGRGFAWYLGGGSVSFLVDRARVQYPLP